MPTTFTPKLIFKRSFWKVELPSEKKYKKQLWIQQYEDGKLAVDWETDVFYNPMTWDDFLAKKPIEPLTFRVYVGWDNFYVHPYTNESKYQAYQLENRDSDQRATAYTHKKSPASALMLQLIKNHARDPKRLETSTIIYAANLAHIIRNRPNITAKINRQ